MLKILKKKSQNKNTESMKEKKKRRKKKNFRKEEENGEREAKEEREREKTSSRRSSVRTQGEQREIFWFELRLRSSWIKVKTNRNDDNFRRHRTREWNRNRTKELWEIKRERKKENKKQISNIKGAKNNGRQRITKKGKKMKKR